MSSQVCLLRVTIWRTILSIKLLNLQECFSMVLRLTNQMVISTSILTRERDTSIALAFCSIERNECVWGRIEIAVIAF